MQINKNLLKYFYRGLVVLIFTIGIMSGFFTPLHAKENLSSNQVDIVFTHDLHSHLKSYEIEDNGEQISIGGAARLKTLLDEKRSQNPEQLVVDAGDMAMGTLFQTLIKDEAIEYRMLGELGFDAVTFGNHEFDYGSEALAGMFQTASEKEKNLPAFVICNMDWSSTNEGSQAIYKALQKCKLADYVVVEKNGVKIAITGVLGKDALECAPTCELTVLDPIESVKRTVQKIQSDESVDMIVCLSHSGTWEDIKKSEDEQLAKAVPELDVIVSAHTHTVLNEPIHSGNTYIVSCGCYGENTGTCHMEQQEDGRWKMTEYKLIRMTDDIAEDDEISSELSTFEKKIDSEYLSEFGLTENQVLVENNIAFEKVEMLEQEHTEHKLGNLMSDAYRYAVNQTPSGKEHPAEIAVVPSGTVRGTYLLGPITVSNVFESFSLGSGADGSIGYPLISLYLTGRELKNVAEVDASVSDYMKTARLYMSGLSFTYNPHRLLLNKVSDCWISSATLEDSRTELEDDRLYRVVTDMYSGRMLGAVTDISKGLLSIKPKDENGEPLTEVEDVIIYDGDGKELKAWYAIASYMQSFEKNEDGVSVIPSYYSTFHNRKGVEDSRNPIALFSNPNRFSICVYAVIAVLILLILLIVRHIIRKKRKKRVMRNK